MMPCMAELTQEQRLVHGVTRRLVVIGWVANAIGAAGVFMAVGFLAAVFFGPDDRDTLGEENWLTAVACVVAFGAVMTVVLKRRRATALRWLIEDREPTELEHRMTLGLPTYTALLTAGGWALGGLIGGLTNLDQGLDAAVLIATAVWLGGDTTSALSYLVSEWIMRPITARALAARPAERTYAPSVRDRLLFAWSLGTAVPVMSVIVVGIVGLTKPGVDFEAVAAAGVFLGSVALAVGLLATLIVSRAITHPLTSMRDAVERVGGRRPRRRAADRRRQRGRAPAGGLQPDGRRPARAGAHP